MNKEQIIKYLKNSIDEKGNYCYSLPIETTKVIIKYIDQLTNNWNELEEWLKSVVEYETLCKGNYMTVRGEWAQEVLDKMKQIKEGKYV